MSGSPRLHTGVDPGRDGNRMKSRMESTEIVVGLDIGTTKVSAVVGEVDADGITILGVGNVPCRGLRKGVVSNIDWTVRSIAEAIDAAQTMAGVEIRTVYAGVAGSHIRSQTSDGVAAIAGGEVTRADVDRVLEGARAIPVDADRQILQWHHTRAFWAMFGDRDHVWQDSRCAGNRFGPGVQWRTGHLDRKRAVPQHRKPGVRPAETLFSGRVEQVKEPAGGRPGRPRGTRDD